MRFNLKFELSKNEIPLDYRSMFISFIKSAFQEYDTDWYEKNYKESNTGNDPIRKPYTFSVYLNNPKFLKEIVVLSGNELLFNFSTYSPEYGIHFYNSVLKKLYKNCIYLDYEFKLKSITMSKEKVINRESIVFKTLSPIVVRKHDKSTNKDDHLTFDKDGFAEQLKENIAESAMKFFDFDIRADIEALKINTGGMKTVLVSHFSDRVKKRLDGNIGLIEIEGKSYLLDYLYKAGVGSRRSQGFGMVEVVN